jgi:MinD superfamily P-loop ATPase
MELRVKQMTVVSGKGGTGKTSVLASFAALAEDKVIADCDVDASNLYLIMHPDDHDSGGFMGAKVVVRDEDLCARCGICEDTCRFDAITANSTDELACEGCGACVLTCPTDALVLKPIEVGKWYVGTSEHGPMAHARLHPAGESSGRLVTLVRQKAEDLAYAKGLGLILIDGPPGLGCTTTAALADVDLALIVTEPTLSGIHDMERQVQLIKHFGLAAAVIINKWDINVENSAQLRRYCEEQELPVLGEIPFDITVTHALTAQMPLVEFNDGPASQAIRGAWTRTGELLARV